MTYRDMKLPPLRPPRDGNHRTSPPYTTEDSSQSPFQFPRNGSRQDPPPTRSSSICNHLHNDTAPDMWAYRGCLGPEYDEPSANLLARQKRERREYEERRQPQISSKDPSLDLPPFLEPPSSKAQLRARALTAESTHYDGDASADATPNGNTEKLPSPTPSYRYCGFETLVSTHAATSRRPQSELLPAASLEQRSQVTTALKTSNLSSTLAATSSTETSQHSSPGDFSGHARQPASLTAERFHDACSKRHDSLSRNSEGKASNSGSRDSPLHILTAQKSIPALRSNKNASEDLSGYPLKMREFLKTSARGVNQAIEYLGTDDKYEIYEDRVYANKTASRLVVGELRNRHTANIEAAKIFVHRFWRQVMEENHEYQVDMGEYGLIRMDIALEDADDGMISACVGVRKKDGRS